MKPLVVSYLTYFMPLVSFYIPWKHRKQRFTDVLRGYRNRLVAWNGLKRPKYWNHKPFSRWLNLNWILQCCLTIRCWNRALTTDLPWSYLTLPVHPSSIIKGLPVSKTKPMQAGTSHLRPLGSFYVPWKKSENLWFPDIVRRYKKRLMVWHGLIIWYVDLHWNIVCYH